jgi:hypothetical protein
MGKTPIKPRIQSTLRFTEWVATVELGGACSNKKIDEVRELKVRIVSLNNPMLKGRECKLGFSPMHL